ncbi:DUF3558 domain-containing protein [Nocardia nova]|jgi:hypothetical protein|uniref:DUF3558 domain-containing protein n=1 Tax=Nocardia nova TaxID=37330 RepID=UPI000CE9E831|nr:DUF3558 domain-containing protein [Nocardia nova]PPI90686.1 hypothetical protein C5E46_31655 [Nocardia nova]
MKSFPAGLLAGAVICCAAACSGGGTSNSGDSAPATTISTSSVSRPTLTASKLQPPPQHAEDGRSELPSVVFDPCTWISDQTISKAGYDPSSRHRIKDIVAENTFLTCGFKSPLRTLRVNSGNATWAEDLQKNAGKAEPASVNDREAVWVRDPALPESCEIDLRTKVGFVQVISDLTDETNPRQTPPCDGLLDTATAVETEIGKDN